MMTAPTSWTESLLVGIAELLDAAGAGTYSDGTAYAEGDTAIVLIELPDAPERVICLTDYPIEDDPSNGEGIVGVQVRTRAGRTDPLAPRALADAVFATLQGRRNLSFGAATAYPVTVSHIYRESATPIGPDSQGRHERSENYYVHVVRTSAGIDE